MAIRISTMTPDDLRFAVAMTDAENWGYLPADFERLMRLQPEGCFIARNRFRRIGIVSTTCHGNYAFMGTLIVMKNRRGRGVGEELFTHALEFLRRRGASTIELDGVFGAVRLYRRLGFVDKYLSLRMVRPPARATEKSEVVRSASLDELLQFDRETVMLDRSAILARFHVDMPESLIAIGESKIAAYAFVRARSQNRATIGPFVARTPHDAFQLLGTLLGRYGDTTLSIGVPECQQEFVRALLDAGFHHRCPSLRMYYGERLEFEKCVFGIISPEKG